MRRPLLSVRDELLPEFAREVVNVLGVQRVQFLAKAREFGKNIRKPACYRGDGFKAGYGHFNHRQVVGALDGLPRF